MGIIDRIGSLAGTELSHAVNLAHETFQDRMGEHGHTGRALVETLAKVCRDHPNIVGIGAGLLVEQLLVHEKHIYDARHDGDAHAGAGHATPAAPGRAPATIEHHPALHGIKISKVKPGKIAFEVFGALVVLKLGAAFTRMFRRKGRHDVWFAPVAKIHSISGAFAAYYLASAIKSPKVSSVRNALVVLFATHAVKPLLKADRKRRRTAAAAPAVAYAAPSPPAVVEHASAHEPGHSHGHDEHAPPPDDHDHGHAVH